MRRISEKFGVAPDFWVTGFIFSFLRILIVLVYFKILHSGPRKRNLISLGAPNFGETFWVP